MEQSQLSYRELQKICSSNKKLIDQKHGPNFSCKSTRSELLRVLQAEGLLGLPPSPSQRHLRTQSLVDDKKKKADKEEPVKLTISTVVGPKIPKFGPADRVGTLRAYCKENKTQLEQILGRIVNCNLRKSKLLTLLENAKIIQSLTDANRSREIKYLSAPDPSVDYSRVEDRSNIFIHPTNYDKLFDSEPNVLKDIDITGIICSELMGHDKSLNEIFRDLNECPTGLNCSNDLCTNISHKMASSLIRIASERIFADPEQSILELIVNSIDAYYPEKRIGKFGLGFFSILYWLVNHDKRYINIYSFHDKERSFRATLRYSHGFLLTLAYAQENLNPRPGVTIYINAINDPFPRPERFVSQVQKIRYRDDIVLYLTYESVDHINNITYNFDKKENKPIVYTFVSGNELINEDYATGISLDILIKSLLVPSISTKSLKMQVGRGDFVSNSRSVARLESIESNLYILISGVSIVKLVKHHYTDSDISHDYIIDMPPNTTVPVSRDDIILNNTTKKDFVNGIIHLAETVTIRWNLLPILQDLLNNYVAYTSNQINRDAVNRALTTFYRDNLRRLVPADAINAYRRISNKFIASNYYDIWTIQEELDAQAHMKLYDVWYGKKVIILPLENSMRAYVDISVPSYIVVNEAYINDHPDTWIDNITLSYKSEKLIPIVTKIPLSDDIKRYRSFIGKVTENFDYDIYYVLMARFDYLSIYFDISTYQFKKFAALLKELNKLGTTNFRAIMVAFMERFARFKGNNQYGGEKYKLYVSTTGPAISKTIVFKNLDILRNNEKLMKFIIDSIVHAIHSIPERIKTNIRIYITLSITTLFFKSPLVDHLINISNNAIEFTILLSFAKYHKTDINLQIKKGNDGVIFGYFSYLLDKLRSYYITWNDMELTFENALLPIPNLYVTQKLEMELRNWLGTLAGIIPRSLDYNPLMLHYFTNITDRTPTQQEIKKSYDIMSSQLINYIFVSNITPDDVLPEILELAADQPTSLKTQVLEIVINEGTTKPPLEAAITELIQNSVDAIREYAKSSDTESDIRVNTYQSDDSFILNISDRIGINAWGFIHLSIPFLSTKSVSRGITTGEMGSGFFNVYRGTSKVVVNTVHNGTHIHSVDTPIIDSHGRVVDINKTITITNRKDAINGTTITLFYPLTNGPEEHIATVAYQMSSVIGLIDMEIAKIYYNEIQVNIPKTLYYEDDITQIFFNETNKPSYILTNGIPFTNLDNFLADASYAVQHLLSSGVVVNILPGGYTPVQTRTKIVTRDDELIRNSIYRAIFIVALLTEWQNIQHIHSYSSASQLRFQHIGTVRYTKYANTPPTILTYLNLVNPSQIHLDISDVSILMDGSKSYTSIATIINNGIQEMRDNVYDDVSKEVENIIDSIMKYIYGYTDITRTHIREVIIKWFKPKNKYPESIMTIKKTGQTKLPAIDDQDPEYKQLAKFLRIWVKTYISIGLRIGITGFTDDMVLDSYVVYGSGRPESIGFFEPKTKSLAITSVMWPIENLAMSLDIILAWKGTNKKPIDSLTQLSNNKLWNKLFSISVPASVVIHEFEHARRRAEGHDIITVELYDGDTEKERFFDECANDVFIKIIENGFYEELIRNLHTTQ